MQPQRRTIHRCADCLAILGTDPLRWYLDNGLWQPVCYTCWFARLEVEQGLHVAVASTICKERSYELDNPPAVIRERRKVGGVE